MKKSLIVIVTLLVAIALVACSQPTQPAQTTPPASTSVEATPSSEGSAGTVPAGQTAPSATAIWDSTISTGSYKAWAPAPGYGSVQPAKGPHGKSVQIFMNPTAEATLKSGATTWPTGSVIVKDAYDADNKLMQIEYMEKTDAGWYYASFSPDGSVSVEGVNVEPCNGCHTKAPTNDGVKAIKLPG